MLHIPALQPDHRSIKFVQALGNQPRKQNSVVGLFPDNVLKFVF
jgi:hypothetical protein